LSDTAEEQLKKLEEILDEYDKANSVKVGKNDKVGDYLGYTREDLTKLSEEDCSMMSFELSSFSFNLQKEYNRQKAKADWAEANIKIHASKRFSQYKSQYQNYEELKMLTILGDEYTKKLFQLKTQAETRMNEFYGLSAKVELIINSLKDVKFSKKNNR